MPFTVTKTNPVTCPVCLRTMDSHASNDPAEPETGDFSICLNCGTVNVFTSELILRKAEDKELQVLAEEQPRLLMQIVEVSAKFRAKYARRNK